FQAIGDKILRSSRSKSLSSDFPRRICVLFSAKATKSASWIGNIAFERAKQTSPSTKCRSNRGIFITAPFFLNPSSAKTLARGPEESFFSRYHFTRSKRKNNPRSSCFSRLKGPIFFGRSARLWKSRKVAGSKV